LKSGDNVEVRVVITNVSDEDKANISYVDNFPPGFILDKDADIISSIDGYDMMDGIGTFDYMFD
jgi:ligand-binding sensor protein